MMNEGSGYVVAVLLIIGFVFVLVRQIQHTSAIQNGDRTVDYKRALLGNSLMCIALAGFLVSFGLNLIVSMKFMESITITSNNTNAGCFIFLAVLFIAKFGIIPKSTKQSSLSS